MVKSIEEMMKRVYYILCVCALFIGTCAHTHAAGTAAGNSCDNPILLTDGYTVNIPGAKTVWYSAWTYDLPLAVYFVPQNGYADPQPVVEMDFSCKSGFYKDSIICELFCKNSGSGIQFDLPHRPRLEKGQTDDGSPCYYIAIGEEYRDLLLQAGISYNVEVFVKVEYKSAGTISIAPDTMFTSCMDQAKFMRLGDTIHVKPMDSERHVIVPYVQWQEDSIRYVWISEQPYAPCTLAIANKCDFDPRDNGDPNIIDGNFDGADTLKVTSALLRDYVSNPDYPNEAGMYFAKCYSTSPGVLKIERVPQAPPEGGATLLRYNQITPIPADTDALFAIPFTWDTASIFTTPTDHVFKMYIGLGPDFTLPEAIRTYQFHKSKDGHWLGVPDEEMKTLWSDVTEPYLYVRFECTAKTTLKPAIWKPSSCMKWQEITYPVCTLNLAKSYNTYSYYRFHFSEWAGGNMNFKWTNTTGSCQIYLDSACSFAPQAGKVIEYREMNTTNATTWSRTPQRMVNKNWAGKVDEDGYLYFLFYANSPGTMILISEAPPEQDPVETYPAASIAVICGEKTEAGQQYTVRVSHDQTLSLFEDEITDFTGLTPTQTWSQTTSQTHSLILAPGTYTLHGDVENLLLKVE